MVISTDYFVILIYSEITMSASMLRLFVILKRLDHMDSKIRLFNFMQVSKTDFSKQKEREKILPSLKEKPCSPTGKFLIKIIEVLLTCF